MADEYTPTRAEIIAGEVDDHERHWAALTEAEVERGIAAIERAAAGKSLTDAVQRVADRSEAYAATARRMHDNDEMEDSSRYFNYAAGLNMAIPVLRARAAEIREGK